jgi:hypothetical protein
MSDRGRRALFADLVFNEEGQVAPTVDVGGVPHYAIPHAGFLRHVEAEVVDRQIVSMLKERFLAMRDILAAGVAHMLGQDDVFTRASIEHAIENMDRLFEVGHVDVDELRTVLWMMKFRAIVDVHGQVIRLEMPEPVAGDDEE